MLGVGPELVDPFTTLLSLIDFRFDFVAKSAGYLFGLELFSRPKMHPKQKVHNHLFFFSLRPSYLTKRQRRDLSVFESSYHLPTSLSHTVEASHCLFLLLTFTVAGKLWIPIFIVFGLARPRIELEFMDILCESAVLEKLRDICPPPLFRGAESATDVLPFRELNTLL